MTQPVCRSILRLVAVATVLIGAILVSHSVIVGIATTEWTRELSSSVQRLAARGVDVPSAQRLVWAGILSHVMTIALGLVLFAWSGPLARACAEPSSREAGNGSNG